MSGDKDLDHSEDRSSAEEALSGEPDDPGKGLGVGGALADLIYDVENDLEHQRADSEDDPGSGLGTGREVRAPRSRKRA
jgi:hypothetical protein